MKNNILNTIASKIILGAIISLFAISCGNTEKSEKVSEEATIKDIKPVKAEVNADSLINAIDQRRTEIEESIKEEIEYSTENSRSKLKQKWSKIHFYEEDGQLVRVKTYPHTSISSRTEEFYLQDGELVLAVIEDDGAGEKGKDKAAIDKMYYFNNGKVISEKNKSTESEYSIKESDGEELLVEIKEYIDIYKSNKK